MVDPMDPHGLSRPRRSRPFIAATVAPEVAAAVRDEAERTGRPLAHVIEDRLRAGYGLPVEPRAA